MAEESTELNRSANFQERIDAIDMKFQVLGIKEEMVTQKNKDSEKSGLDVKSTPEFNTRGQAIFSPTQIRKNYDNAFYGFKWTQMPFCVQTIKRKLQFWAGASGLLAFTYGEYLKKKDPKNPIKKLPKGTYPAAWITFFAISSIYCFAQSLLFDEFCDIESPFYQQTENRLTLARRIRTDMDKNKSKGVFREMF